MSPIPLAVSRMALTPAPASVRTDALGLALDFQPDVGHREPERVATTQKFQGV